MPRNKHFATISLAMALVTGACTHGNERYADFHAFPSEEWVYGDTVTLAPSLPDSVATGTLLLSLRHTDAYPFSNIWLEVEVPGTMRDTFDIKLADNMGHWFGRASGVSVSVIDTIAPMITLRHDQPVRIRHIMRPDKISEIERIGIILATNGNK